MSERNELREALKWALNHVVTDEEMGTTEIVRWREEYAKARTLANGDSAARSPAPSGLPPNIPVPVPNAGDLDGQSLIDMNNLAVGYGVPSYQPGVPATANSKQEGERERVLEKPYSIPGLTPVCPHCRYGGTMCAVCGYGD